VVQLDTRKAGSSYPAMVSELLAIDFPLGVLTSSRAEETSEAASVVNVQYLTEKPEVLWPLIRQHLQQLGLEDAVIVVCTGRKEWADYLLLYHYDPAQALDGFPESGRWCDHEPARGRGSVGLNCEVRDGSWGRTRPLVPCDFPNREGQRSLAAGSRTTASIGT